MLIVPTYVDDLEAGQSIRFAFQSRATTGAPASIVGGAVRAVRLADGTTNTSSVALLGNYGSVTGRNVVTIDGANAFWAAQRDYVIDLSAGMVGGVNVAGVIVGHVTVANRASGIMLARTIVVPNGQVLGVDPTSPRQKFTVAMNNYDFTGRTDDPFINNNLIVQSGTAAGQGRLVRRSTPSGTNIIIELQEPLSVAMAIGDTVAIIPQEGAEEFYYFKPTAEFGDINSYSLSWHRNGRPYAPDVGAQCLLTVVDTTMGQTLIAGESMISRGDGEFYYETTAPAKLVSPNHHVSIEATTTFHGMTRTDRRPYPYAA